MRTRLTLSILACLVLLALIIAPLQFAWAAEPPPTQWEKTFGGTGGNYAYSVQQTADGGYVLAGFTASYGAGGNDAWFIKVASEVLAPTITSISPSAGWGLGPGA